MTTPDKDEGATMSLHDIRTLETASPELLALIECLKICAPGVKWRPSLASTFERMLLKRGYEIRKVK